MYRAMIVDDLKFARDELKSYDFWGEKVGFVISAESDNGRDALYILRKQPVDLIITDIRMPIIDGIDLTKVALEEKLCKSVILISQFKDFEYARKGIHYGAFEYLLKPVEKEDLRATLHRVSVRINERTQELIKINYADQVLKNKDIYPHDQYKLLIKSIDDKNTDTVKLASRIFETIWMETDSDIAKAFYYLNRLIHNFVDDILVAHPWIGKIKKAEPKKDLSTASLSMNDAKVFFVSYINEMKAFISEYELGPKDDSIINTACKYVLENIDAPITLNALSKKLFISNSYLSYLFKKEAGINISEYITRIKLERSKVLLEEGALKNYEIAEKLGYNIEYYSKLFKKHYAISPSEHRKLLKKSKFDRG